jgi:hypothetical protein
MAMMTLSTFTTKNSLLKVYIIRLKPLVMSKKSFKEAAEFLHEWIKVEKHQATVISMK